MWIIKNSKCKFIMREGGTPGTCLVVLFTCLTWATQSMIMVCDGFIVWHKLSEIRSSLFSLTKLSVLRTIEKHCTAAIWLLRPKIWTHFQTITSHFPDRDYYCTENRIGFHFNTLYSHVMFDCNDRFIFQYLYLSNRRPFCILDGMTIMKVFLCALVTMSPLPFNGADILI